MEGANFPSIGHAGRPYYICSSGSGPEGHFICFDDDKGIDPNNNPPCGCGYTSRLTRRRDRDGTFYSCPIGKCYFNRNGPADLPQGSSSWGGELYGSQIPELDGSQVAEVDGDGDVIMG
jgi:hypothetical protein